MQDEINEKVIALSIRTTKLTAEMLQKSIRFMLSQIKKQLDNANCKASPFPLCAFNLTLTLLLDKESDAR